MGKLELCNYVFVWFSYVWREAECLAELLVWLFFNPPPPHPSCSATVLNASPSAHDQSAAALRRPPARHLAALRLFLEALLFVQSPRQQVDKSSGQEHRWKHTREGNWTLRWTSCYSPRKLRCRLFSSPGFVARWAECGVRRSAFFFPPK